MKRILRLITIFIFLFSLAQTDVFAQKKSRKMLKADKAFEMEEYVRAIELYKKAYKKTKIRAIKSEIIFKQAECFRLSGNIKRAESYYKRAIRAKYDAAIVYLRYADALRMQGNYDEASEQYQEYLKNCGITKEESLLLATDKLKVKRYIHGELGLRSCAFAIKWKDVPTRYIVELMPIINNRNSDYSPAFGNEEYNELYFTSSRTGGLIDKISKKTGQPFSDIWFTKIDQKGKWSRPSVMFEPINTAGMEGPVYVNKRGTAMYLTQCKVEKKKDLGCKIYVSKRKGKLWGTPQLLQIKLDSNISIGHPALSDDEKTLIFSSDFPGGSGGKDLWVSVKSKRNTWSEPANLGLMINTPGDEMFPFLQDDGTIYFASDGHIGMGGFDIFTSSQDEFGNYTLPINLKSPINSSADDFSMIIEKDGERGYLTSNRVGGKGGDDIYQFELTSLKLAVQGIVTDSKTGEIVTRVKVQLIDNDGAINEVVTDNTGKYEFKLKPLKSYEIVVNTKGYLKKIIRETTQGALLSKTYIIDISIDPCKKEIVLPLISYDFNKYDLRPESIIDLDNLAESLLDNSSVVIELKSHTDYIGSNIQNKKLSQQRANACIAYLITQGVDPDQLIAKGMGENEPFVIDIRDGKLKEGDVLTESYIRKIKSKKNKSKANQYNRRTSFKVISGNGDGDCNDDMNKIIPKEMSLVEKDKFEELFKNDNKRLVVDQVKSENYNSKFNWKVSNTADHPLRLSYVGEKSGIININPNSSKSITLDPGVYKVIVVHAYDEKITKPFSATYSFKKGYEAENSYNIKFNIPNKK